MLVYLEFCSRKRGTVLHYAAHFIFQITVPFTVRLIFVKPDEPMMNKPAELSIVTGWQVLLDFCQIKSCRYTHMWHTWLFSTHILLSPLKPGDLFKLAMLSSLHWSAQGAAATVQHHIVTAAAHIEHLISPHPLQHPPVGSNFPPKRGGVRLSSLSEQV